MRRIDPTLGFNERIELLIKVGYFLVYIMQHHSTSDESYIYISPIVPPTAMDTVRKWCIDQFTYKHFIEFRGLFVFTKEEDALLFKLTWMCCHDIQN
jgi:hypothetical protein